MSKPLTRSGLTILTQHSALSAKLARQFYTDLGRKRGACDAFFGFRDPEGNLINVVDGEAQLPATRTA
ncbi:MAG: hypothetical protein ACK4IS_09615 [Erythrobacter sp.]